jgi:hypothetical protein
MQKEMDFTSVLDALLAFSFACIKLLPVTPSTKITTRFFSVSITFEATFVANLIGSAFACAGFVAVAFII